MHVTVDGAVHGALHASVREEGAAPLVFTPDVDFEHLAQRTIIDAY